ncbi:LysM peptidoglycan-binding domain-containing protein [Geomonas sp. Red32]|uniref:LysM peptidoglycan-binding domain-containing protein n=1 Tax=Geomonas sp. Red32 TaxID=2912856 RepID=UPI00202CE916|nr:LysM peptidoglycan-binding domain-containing protein [Geomonas sp. Red32]
MLERARSAGADTQLATEFRSALEAYGRGENYFNDGDTEEADSYYELALMKGELLEKELAAIKAKRLEEARLAEERKRAEEERLAREEANRKAQAELEALAQKERAQAEEAARAKRAVKPVPKEHVLVSTYTVRRGESLPYIASQPEVYGDRMLWPLIYRANRAQIRDPRHIWPGQVLKIPRNLSREDIAEARRYSQDRLLH